MAALVALVIGWFAVGFAGRWPRRMRPFAVSRMRCTSRVKAYRSLIVDQHPPFGFQA